MRRASTGRFPLTTFALVALVVASAHRAAADCPSSTVSPNNAPPAQVSGASGTGSYQTGGGFGGGWYSFQEYGAVAEASYGSGGSLVLTARGRYRFLGLAPGTMVSNQVQLRVTGSMFGNPIGMPCAATSFAQFSFVQDGIGIANGTWQNQPESWPGDQCRGGMDQAYTFTCSHPIGTEFEFASTVTASSSEWGSANVKTTVTFGDLPPGAFMVRCDGDTTVQVLDVGPAVSSTLRIDAVWPNPSRGEFRAALTAPTAAPAHVRLLDVNGRVVESRAWYAVPGERRELAFGHSLAPGNYFLQVKQGALSAVREVVVLK